MKFHFNRNIFKLYTLNKQFIILQRSTLIRIHNHLLMRTLLSFTRLYLTTQSIQIHIKYARAASRDFLLISDRCSRFFWRSWRLMPAIAFWILKDFLFRRLLFSAAYIQLKVVTRLQSSCYYVAKQLSNEYEQVVSFDYSMNNTCEKDSGQAKRTN